ncbi:hypothetical protein HOC96_05690 [archaeon]|nr:hypothetical protein [archaeon]
MTEQHSEKHPEQISKTISEQHSKQVSEKASESKPSIQVKEVHETETEKSSPKENTPKKGSSSDINNQREAFIEKIKSVFTPSKESVAGESVSKATEHHKKQDSDKEEEEAKISSERDQLFNFLKAKKDYFQYLILAIIIAFGSWIRTRNLGILKDTTTGDFIPLALDPYLFTRYANEIIEKGSLAAYDAGRFVPEGISTIKYWMTSYFIAYLYKFLHLFNSDVTVNYASVIYPVVAFAGAMVFFFLLCRKLFDWKIATLATLFLAIVPSFLHRTMAGFADHEALGTLYLFMAMYWYVCAWQTKTTKKTIIYASLAGLATGAMGVTWGGWKFLLLLISGFTLIEFFMEKTTRKDLYQYLSWMLGILLVTTILVPQYSISDLVGSFTSAIAFLVLAILILHEVLTSKKFQHLQTTVQKTLKFKLPKSVFTAILAGILGLIAVFTVVGIEPIIDHGSDIVNSILHPLGNNRWELTVAEQHQPYFTDWMGQYGPMFFGSIPLYLLLFMAGSVLLFYTAINKTKHKWKLTSVYIAFILAFTMSRYSASSTFNGINGISIGVYMGSLIAFALTLAGTFLYAFYKDKSLYEQIIAIDKKYIFILVWFIIMVVAARGAVRLFYIFTPITALLASFATFDIVDKIKTIPQKSYKIAALVILLFFLISPLAAPMKGIIPSFGENVIAQSTHSGPGYNFQWQQAGEWVKENIPTDAVFGHWWDYGYWVQTGWERDTVLDGTNKITNWNYLMGRHVMCGQDQVEALEFLDVHETTHFLIVPEEIGKYTAYSSIGSDENYDRYSWITTFGLDENLMHETRNATVIGYQGTYVLDDNFVFEDRVYAAQNSAAVAVYLPLIIDEGSNVLNIEDPYLILTGGGSQVEVPLSCVYMNGEFFFNDHEDENSYNGCFSVIPTINSDGSVSSTFGAGLFVSEEGFKALWTNLYIFEGKNPYFDTSAFDLVYDQTPSYAPLSIYGGRVIGPIKIWEIDYPEGFEVSEEKTEQYLGHNEYLPDYFFDVN